MIVPFAHRPVLLAALAAAVFSACAGSSGSRRANSVGCRPGGADGMYGQVVDSATHAPLVGVRVWTEPATDVWRSDRDGCFHLGPKVAPRSYMVRFRRDASDAAAYWDKHVDADYKGGSLALGVIKLARDKPPDVENVNTDPTNDTGVATPE